VRVCGFFPSFLARGARPGPGLRLPGGRRLWSLHSVAMCLALFFLGGCQAAKPKFVDVIKGFNGELQSTTQPADKAAGDKIATDKAGPPAGAIRFFVDCSAGMKGFVAPQRSGQPSNYIRVLETLAKTTSYETAWHCAGANPTSNLAASTLLQAGTYQASSHSLGALIDTTEQPEVQIAKPSIDVIVSDLAGSENVDAAGALARDLKKFSEQKRQLLLWAFRSSYSGDYKAASFACQGSTVQLREGQTLPGLGRPFYLLISAPDAASLASWMESFSKVLLPSAEFVLAKPPVALSDLDTAAAGKSDPGSAGQTGKNWLPNVVHAVAGAEKDVTSGFTVRRYSAFTFDTSNSVTVEFPWKAEFSIPVEAGGLLENIKIIKSEVKAWPPRGPDDIVPADDHDLKVEFVEDPKHRDHLSYKATFPLQGTRWRVYRIALSVVDNTVPKWMSEWTAADDCDEVRGNRTIDLKGLGAALSAASWKGKPFFEHYIAIRRK